MNIRGKWRVIKSPGYDMATPGSYILFDEEGGEFALDCLTGSIHGSSDGNAVEFTWDGNDEMDEASGDGWAQLQTNGTLQGEISLQNGDDIPFIARK
jgi:hypothetical protein